MDDELITSEDARSHATWLLTLIGDNVALGRRLPDDAVSVMADLLDWVSAVADVGGIDVQ
jgi:hypothetical protein